MIKKYIKKALECSRLHSELVDGIMNGERADNEKNSVTDNEIIKALECCISNTKDCSECVFLGTEIKENTTCEVKMIKNALDLIKRKDEQIEALIAGQETLQKYIADKDAEIEGLRSRNLKQSVEIDTLRNSAKTSTIIIENLENKSRTMTTEIERLSNINQSLTNHLTNTRAEAIKEFAERLRFEIINKPSMFKANQGTVDFLNGMTHRQHEILNDLDNLVKEMVGEG